ncbi:uncharacterized protein SPSK_05639 [Sporothrix schenckii 1099-18]|uniref:Uncharacterized protein n=1 Tax=Sporothrix schenckii 1099-18 TaxID=1397361 RepID=A0A0F2LTV7_SPOSC|nr:uncharacterized protein SPSK_05639 [Sporothrix schenckii 1099-18]KJR80917.1 hypothetical protein SPSK_05639 [Sporothrix schenckii 1099-18]
MSLIALFANPSKPSSRVSVTATSVLRVTSFLSGLLARQDRFASLYIKFNLFSPASRAATALLRRSHQHVKHLFSASTPNHPPPPALSPQIWPSVFAVARSVSLVRVYCFDIAMPSEAESTQGMDPQKTNVLCSKGKSQAVPNPDEHVFDDAFEAFFI